MKATIEEQRTKLYSQLWAVADELRGRMDSSNFKNYMLSIIFYRDLSERTSQEVSSFLENEAEELKSYEAAWALEDYREEIRSHLLLCLGYVIEPNDLFSNMVNEIKLGSADWHIDRITTAFGSLTNSTIGQPSQEAFGDLFSSIDLNSPSLGKTLKDKTDLMGRIIQRIAAINFYSSDVEIDLLGDAYEYLIGQFASDAGKKGGEFYTPQEVATLVAKLVSGLKPDLKSVYDPTCGSGSLLFRVVRELTKDNPKRAKLIRLEGQELNIETYNLARMNLILHDVPWTNFNVQNGDTLAEDLHSDKLYEGIVANPPYSTKWERPDPKITLQDERFAPAGALAPPSKADLAFVQHIVHHMDEDGVAAVVLPIGVLYRAAAEAKIRKWLVDQNYVDAIIGLPGGIFNAGVTTFILVLRKGRKKKAKIRFIDASQDFIKTKQLNVVTQDSIDSILKHYVGNEKHPKGKDKKGYSTLVTREEIIENNYSLQINLYVSKPIVSNLPSWEEVQNLLTANQKAIAKSVGNIEDMGLKFGGKKVKFDELIPKDVPNVPLWEVTEWDKNFREVEALKQPSIWNLTAVWRWGTVRDISSSDGDVSVLTSSARMEMVESSKIDHTYDEGEGVTLSYGGSPNIKYFSGKFINAGNRTAKSLDTNKLSNRFLYWMLKNDEPLIDNYYRGSGLRHADLRKVLDHQIPLPSLEIQNRIVEILDAHNLLAELQEERVRLLKLQKNVLLESIFQKI